MKKILALLEEFQAGYTARDKIAVNGFVEKLFVPGDSAFVLGTGSGELFTGEEKVRELVSDDWEYWGDLRLDLEKARIGTAGDHGWFVVEGRVSRSFEDSTARCDRYLSFVADKIKDKSMNPGTRLAASALKQGATGSTATYPVRLTASITRASGSWRIRQAHLSHPDFWLLEGKVDSPQ